MIDAATMTQAQSEQWPWWLPTPAAMKKRERIKAGKFFLINAAAGPAGAIWKCRRCGSKHRYFTTFCVERPFDGLTGGLYGYWRLAGAAAVRAHLPAAQRAQLDRIGEVFGTPDLSTSHPETARQLATATGDVDLGALALGVLEPIPPSLARRLVERINRRAGRDVLILPGLLTESGG